MRLGYLALYALADRVRPLVQGIIDETRQLGPDDIRKALKELGSNVGSERSLGIIMERICEA